MISPIGARHAGVSLFASLVLAACGGGGGGGSGSSTSAANAPPPNLAPIANAGADATFFRTESVTLDGRASSDPENAPLTYSWTQTSGPAVTLSGTTTARPTFTAPRATGVLTFALVVNDGTNASATDSVAITVQNRVPIANAGADRNATLGQAIEVDVSASSDPDGDALTYTWRQISGPAAAVTPLGNGRFSLAAVSTTSVRTYGLVASDGELSSAEDLLIITVTPTGTNAAPVVDAGADRTVARGALVSLSGFAADPDGHAVTVRWEQVAGPSVTLSSTSSLAPTFTTPLTNGVMQFRLNGTDGTLDAPPDLVTLTLRNEAPRFNGFTMLPDSVNTTDEIVATPRVEDADNDPITLTYEWKKNGTTIPGLTGPRVPPYTVKRGDVIAVFVTASDGVLSRTNGHGLVVSDAPPQVSITPPATVQHGQLFEFDVQVTDPDGDGPYFTLQYGPAGMQIDEFGHVTWTPHQPMFDRQLDVTFAIGVSSYHSETISTKGTTRVVDSDRQYPFRRMGHESWIDSGTQVLDMDGDGADEILVGGSSSVYELKRQGSEYVQTWVHPFWIGGAGLTAITTGDTNGDGHQEIFVAAGDIHVIDGATRRISVFREQPPGVQCFHLASADLDGNGDRELVCDSRESLPGHERVIAYGAAGQVRWQTPEGLTAHILEVANVDNDPQLEVITASRVYDGVSGALQWDLAGEFPNVTDVGDVTGDGIAELITLGVVGGVTQVQAVDVPTQSSVWSFGASTRDLAKAVDLNGDGRSEVLITSAGPDTIAAVRRNPDASTTFLFETSDTTVKLHSLAVGDPDHDGAKEIVYAGEATPGPSITKFAVVSTAATPVVEWTNESPATLEAPFIGGKLARTSGNQQRLIFGVAQTDLGTAGTRVLSMNPLTGAVATSPQIGRNEANSLALEVIDTDGDGRDEVMTATNDGGEGYFAMYDPVSNAVEHRTAMGQDMGAAVASAHYDFSGDGTDELITLGKDGYVRVYDPIQRVVLWKSPTADASPKDLVLFDADYEPTKEIIVAGAQGITTYYMQDPTEFTPLSGLIPDMTGSVVDLLAADTDADYDPNEELFVLTSFNEIYRFGFQMEKLLPHLQPYKAPPGAASLHLEDLDVLRKNLVVSATVKDVPGLVAIDAIGGQIIWQSPNVGHTRSDALRYVDVDSDGEREIAFATQRGMFLTR
jgi:hypothetical protein